MLLSTAPGTESSEVEPRGDRRQIRWGGEQKEVKKDMVKRRESGA